MSVTTAPPKEGLIRAAAMEIRSEGDGPARLSGHAVVFDTWTEIRSAWEGNFLERMAPGSARKTLREQGSNIKLLLEHGQDPTVGQKPLGRFTDLREDETGVFYDAELYSDASYVADLLPALRDGQYGASFRFNVVREEWNDNPEPSDHNPKGLPERTIKEARIAEMGPVLWGAYPSATSQARSLTDVFVFRRLMDLPPAQIRELRDLWETVELRSRELHTEDRDGDEFGPGPAATEAPEADAEERAEEVTESAEDSTETSTAPDSDESRREDEDAAAPAVEATPQRVKARRSYLPPNNTKPKERKPWTLP